MFVSFPSFRQENHPLLTPLLDHYQRTGIKDFFDMNCSVRRSLIKGLYDKSGWP